ncbi:MAG TPA: fasciclin domain-containing protein, partial [Cellvibrionaceae bacterium]
YFKSLAILALSLGLAACGSSDKGTPEPPPPPPAEPMSIVDVAVDNGNFTTLVAALEATGLDDVLDDPDGTFTVFAPTDDAFALLGEETISALLADTDTLSNILLYHVITDAEIDSSAAVASAGNTVEMANGQSVGLSLDGEFLLVNVSVVTMEDVPADNGVIHVIDAVLMPPAVKGEPTANIVETAVAAGNFTTLVAALEAANLDSVLADEEETFTVFAPTDAAFEMLGEDNINALLGDNEALQAVLLQHVITGAEVNSIAAYAANGTSVETASGAMIPVMIQDRMLQIGGATVVTADIYTSNGVIHVIDTVIVGDLELPSPPMSIVDVAVDNGNFTTLVAALEATGLDAVLADLEGSFTVFAPTDAAFAELGEDTINGLLADTDTLSDILLYHVIADAEILADAAIGVANADSSLVEMANGKNAGLSFNGDNLFINLSQVTTANEMADNGVIHVIDKVMMPPADMGTPTANIVETAIAAGNFTTLVDAVVQAGLDGVLSDEDATFTVFAPTDEAFAKIDSGTLNALIADVPALTSVLLQHVVSGAAVDSVTAFTLNGTDVETAEGEMVSLEIVDGMLQVEGSNIVVYDIYTTNGIIHVIDTVITSTLE